MWGRPSRKCQRRSVKLRLPALSLTKEVRLGERGASRIAKGLNEMGSIGAASGVRTHDIRSHSAAFCH